jgi:hypothetical protein
MSPHGGPLLGRPRTGEEEMEQTTNRIRQTRRWKTAAIVAFRWSQTAVSVSNYAEQNDVCYCLFVFHPRAIETSTLYRGSMNIRVNIYFIYIVLVYESTSLGAFLKKLFYGAEVG